jgi:hypothetical protein
MRIAEKPAISFTVERWQEMYISLIKSLLQDQPSAGSEKKPLP